MSFIRPDKYLTFLLNEYYKFLVKMKRVLVSTSKNSAQKISVTQNQSFYFTIFREFPIKSCLRLSTSTEYSAALLQLILGMPSSTKNYSARLACNYIPILSFVRERCHEQKEKCFFFFSSSP